MKLKKYRTMHKLSVADVADSLGVSRQHIYEIERGSAFPSRSLALKIEAYTKGYVTAMDLLFPDTL
jgi:DNA-binding XRE family transcriptional regulator